MSTHIMIHVDEDGGRGIKASFRDLPGAPETVVFSLSLDGQDISVFIPVERVGELVTALQSAVYDE